MFVHVHGHYPACHYLEHPPPSPLLPPFLISAPSAPTNGYTVPRLGRRRGSWFRARGRPDAGDGAG